MEIEPITDVGADQPAETAAQQTGFTAEESTYADTVTAQVADMKESLDRANALFLAPRIGQDDWTLAVVVELVYWKQAYKDAQALNPPPAFAEIHDLYLNSLSLFSSAADDIIYGIDHADADRFTQAGSKVTEASVKMGEASRLVDELVKERGG